MGTLTKRVKMEMVLSKSPSRPDSGIHVKAFDLSICSLGLSGRFAANA